MRCVECGHEIKDGAIFCIRCGAMQVTSNSASAGQAPTVNRATSNVGGGPGRGFTPTPKRGGSGIVVFVIAAIAVLAAIVALAMFILNPASSGGGSSSDASLVSASTSGSSSSASSSSSSSSTASSASSKSASKSSASSSASSASASASAANANANNSAASAGQQGAVNAQANGGQAAGGTGGGYMLADSSTRYYSESELSNMSSGDLYIARNEIFARHGRMFKDSYLQNYFNSKSWYKPIYTPEQWDATMGGALSAVETTNAARMLNVENSRNASTQGTSKSSTYVLGDSSSRTYSKSELSKLSAYDLWIARNEIYARHGRGFDNADLQAYFNGKSWYTKKYSPSSFDASVLSSTEQTNLKRIREVESERNSPYA